MFLLLMGSIALFCVLNSILTCCMAVTSIYFEKIYSFAFWNVGVG